MFKSLKNGAVLFQPEPVVNICIYFSLALAMHLLDVAANSTQNFFCIYGKYTI